MNTARAITLTATDTDNDPLTYSIVTPPAHGSLSGTAPNVTYTPTPGYGGSDNFTFRTNDGHLNSDVVTVSITATSSANHAPVANGQAVSTKEDTAVTITLTAMDADRNPLTYSIVTPPAHGSLSGTAPTVIYTPTPGYSGSDNFTFRTNDGHLNSDVVTVSITVTSSTNHAPMANGQAVSTKEDTAVTITLTAMDADRNPLTYSIVDSPAHGSLSGTAPEVTYTPVAKFTGSDIFTFKTNDGTDDSNIAMITIAVKAAATVNDVPNLTQGSGKGVVVNTGGQAVLISVAIALAIIIVLLLLYFVFWKRRARKGH
jgi:hypothetical protein